MNVTQIDLEKLKAACSQIVPAPYAAMVSYEPWVEGMVVQIERIVWSQKIGHEDIRYPADWWAAFKERWFPRWALRRWPVRYARFDVKIYQSYPSLNIQEHKSILRINHTWWPEA